jgi:hypothetical protein
MLEGRITDLTFYTMWLPLRQDLRRNIDWELFENRVLRIFVPREVKRQEVGENRIMRSLHFSQSIIRVIK